MGLADSIDKFSKNSRTYSQYCSYQMFYDKLSKEDQKALDNAWEKGLGVSIVVRAIRKEGHKMSRC